MISGSSPVADYGGSVGKGRHMSDEIKEETFREFYQAIMSDLQRSSVLSKDFVSQVLGWIQHAAYLSSKKGYDQAVNDLRTKLVKGQFTLEMCICSDTETTGHQINCPWLHLKMGTRWAEYMRTYGPDILKEGVRQ